MAERHGSPGGLTCPAAGAVLRYSRHLLIVALSMVLLSAPGFALARASEDVAVQAEKLQRLQQQIHDIKAELDSMQGQRTNVQVELEQAEKEVGRVSAELHRLDAASAVAEQKIRTLNSERAGQRQTLAVLHQTLSQDLRLAYAAGSQPQIKLLLNQQDPAMVGRMMVYHGYFTRARAARMQDLRDTLARLDDIEGALVEQQAGISRNQSLQREKTARLAAEQVRRHKLLASLQGDLRLKANELSALQQDEQRLQSLVQSLRQALRDAAPESGSLRQLKGKLEWPVAGRITRRYGSKQAGLQLRGVLITSRSGTDVHAIAAGRTVFADWLRGFGLLLIIDHGDGYMSLYGHNQGLYKDVGDRVVRGEVVAAAGNSGGLVHDGLYLELRKDGQPFNPTTWFAGQPQPLQSSR